ARGNRTDYTYDANSGSIATITLPAAVSGIRPQTRNTYVASRAWWYTSPGVLQQSPAPVYKLSTTSQCQNLASCAGNLDEVKTTFAYGIAGVPNNLQVSSKTDSDGTGGLARVTTYAYDLRGDLIMTDGPLPGPVDRSYKRWDAVRRLV